MAKRKKSSAMPKSSRRMNDSSGGPIDPKTPRQKKKGPGKKKRLAKLNDPIGGSTNPKVP